MAPQRGAEAREPPRARGRGGGGGIRGYLDRAADDGRRRSVDRPLGRALRLGGGAGACGGSRPCAHVLRRGARARAARPGARVPQHSRVVHHGDRARRRATGCGGRGGGDRSPGVSRRHRRTRHLRGAGGVVRGPLGSHTANVRDVA